MRLQLASAFILVASLCPAVAVASGNCLVEDETSLMQVKQAVKPANERAPMSSSSSPAEKLGEVEAMEKLLSQGLEDSSEEGPEEVATESALSAGMWNDPQDVVSEDISAEIGSQQEAPEVVMEEFGSQQMPELLEEDASGLEAKIASDKDRIKTENGVQVLIEEGAPLPAGCTGNTLCIGRGTVAPDFCGGNENYCKTRGMAVIGWTRQCMGESRGCASGWKVRCAQCGSSVSPAPMPTPAPFEAVWSAPPPPPAVNAPQPTVQPVSVPSFALPSFSYNYNPGAIGNASLALKSAIANLSVFKAAVCNTTSKLDAIQKNISMFSSKEKKASAAALRARRAAVRYAKKSVLANITLMKAMTSMNSAYVAQQGASNNALRMTAVATNSRLKKVYNKKLLIEKQEELRRAQQALRVGKMAVNKASSDMAQAKNFMNRYRSQNRLATARSRQWASRNTKLAQNLAQKQAMEQAYADASPLYGPGGSLKRTLNTVPSWGTGSYFVSTGGTPPCSTPGCTGGVQAA